MVLPSNFSETTNPENIGPNPELMDDNVMELAKALSNFVNTEITIQESYMKRLKALITLLKSNDFLSADTLDQLNKNFSKPLYYGSYDSNFPFSSLIQKVDARQILTRLQFQYLNYLSLVDKALYNEKAKEFLVQRIVRVQTSNPHLKFTIRAGKKHRKGFSTLVKTLIAGFILFVAYKLVIAIYRIISSFLEAVFQILLTKLLKKKSNLKKQSTTYEDEQEKNGDWKKIWSKPFHLVSKITKMNRGGSLAPVQEINSYQFFELDRQHNLQIVSSIPTFSKVETHKVKLERFEVKYPETHSQGRFSRFKVKFKKLIPFHAPSINSKIRVIFLGIVIFMGGANNGTILSPQNRNLPNVERVLQGQGFITSDLLRFALPIEEPRINDEKIIMSMPTQTNQSFKTNESISSRMKSVTRTRKKAKIVHLSDLPPLVDQYSDLDTDMTAKSTPIDIKIKTL
jgi:hypothetical protein